MIALWKYILALSPKTTIYLIVSQVCNSLSAQGTAVLSLSDPLLNALSVEYVHLVAVQSGDKVVAKEVWPANGTLPPQTVLRLPRFAVSSLLVLEFWLVQRRDDFRHWQRNGQKTSKHAFNEDVTSVVSFSVCNFFLELFESHWVWVTILRSISLLLL